MGEKIRVNDPPKKGRKTGKKSPKYLRTVTSKIVPPSTPKKGRFWGLFEQPQGGRSRWSYISNNREQQYEGAVANFATPLRVGDNQFK